MANPFPDYYSILHIAPDATKKQIKDAFYKSKRYATKKGDSKEWRDICIAGNVLCDEQKRTIYDRNRWNLEYQYQLAESYQPMHHSRFNNYNDPFTFTMANPFHDYYSILHIAPDATKKQIKDAFYKSKRYATKKGDSKEWRDICIAGNVLCDEQKRTIYDRNRWNLEYQYQLAESYQPMHHSRFNNYNDPYSWHHNKNCSPKKKSNFWKYFRNFGLICVGCDCLYHVIENDSATIWTIACRCLSGVAIIYICWGCGSVIYTTIKWTAIKLYNLCAFICSCWGELLLFFTCAGCVMVIFKITKYISVKLYNCVTYMAKEIVDIAVKIVPSPGPPLVKGSIILFSIGCVGWGLHKFFRSAIG